jgi:hypothetical protein
MSANPCAALDVVPVAVVVADDISSTSSHLVV